MSKPVDSVTTEGPLDTLQQVSLPKFDEHADDYDLLHARSIAASGEATAYFARYKLDCLLRLDLQRGVPILDYGCGIGNLTEQLVTRFAKVHAYDPSKKSMDVARSRAASAIFHDDADRIPARHFGAAVLSGVLHHVPPSERAALLRRVRAALVPEGTLIVFEHNPLNPLTRRAVRQCPFDDDAVLLWPWQGKALARSAGFSRAVVRHIVFFPRAFAWLRGLEPKLGWLPAGAQWMMVASAGSRAPFGSTL
jgi:SAM-dependent methyltransferase